MSPRLLCLVMLAPFFILFFHAAACWLAVRRGLVVSPQLFLIRLVVSLNLPLLLGVSGITHEWPAFIFALIVFNGFGYAYFHLFNLSETSQRVRLLILLRRGARGSEGTEEYSPRRMVDVRVRRLVEMGQMRADSEGRYRIAGRFFLNAAFLLRAWRRWFGLDGEITA
jgi:hypothetical protein